MKNERKLRVHCQGTVVEKLKMTEKTDFFQKDEKTHEKEGNSA